MTPPPGPFDRGFISPAGSAGALAAMPFIYGSPGTAPIVATYVFDLNPYAAQEAIMSSILHGHLPVGVIEKLIAHETSEQWPVIRECLRLRREHLNDKSAGLIRGDFMATVYSCRKPSAGFAAYLEATGHLGAVEVWQQLGEPIPLLDEPPAGKIVASAAYLFRRAVAEVLKPHVGNS